MEFQHDMVMVCEGWKPHNAMYLSHRATKILVRTYSVIGIFFMLIYLSLKTHHVFSVPILRQIFGSYWRSKNIVLSLKGDLKFVLKF